MFRIIIRSCQPPSAKSPSSPYSLRLKCRDAAKTVRTDLASSHPFLPSTPIHTHPLNRDERLMHVGILAYYDRHSTIEEQLRTTRSCRIITLTELPQTDRDFRGFTALQFLLHFLTFIMRSLLFGKKKTRDLLKKKIFFNYIQMQMYWFIKVWFCYNFKLIILLARKGDLFVAYPFVHKLFLAASNY